MAGDSRLINYIMSQDVGAGHARDSDSRAQALPTNTPFQGRMSPGRAHIEHHRDVRASEHRQRSWFGFAVGEEEPVECRRACPLERGIGG